MAANDLTDGRAGEDVATYGLGPNGRVRYLVCGHLADSRVRHIAADPAYWPEDDGTWGVPTFCGKSGHITMIPPRDGTICKRCDKRQAEHSGRQLQEREQ